MMRLRAMSDPRATIWDDDTAGRPPLAPAPDAWPAAWPNALTSEIPHPSPYVCRLRITPDQLSRSIPHVSNIEYVRWLDRAAELHANDVGAAWRDLFATGRMWFVARHEIDYLAELWEGDDVLIATWVRAFHRVKSWRDSLIVRPADGTLICRASTLWVMVDLANRKPCRIEQAMAERFAPLDSPVAR